MDGVEDAARPNDGLSLSCRERAELAGPPLPSSHVGAVERRENANREDHVLPLLELPSAELAALCLRCHAASQVAPPAIGDTAGRLLHSPLLVPVNCTADEVEPGGGWCTP